MQITEITNCRSCGEKLPLQNVLDLGKQTVVDFLLPGETGRGISPLELVACPYCQLLQLRHTVDSDTLYRVFWYRSSISESMRASLQDIVESAERHVDLMTGDYVCDIGSNDGYLLGCYPPHVNRVGFEPARELAEEASKNSDGVFIPDYFSAPPAISASKNKLYKAVTAIAMLYDVPDPGRFLDDVRSIIHPAGIFIVQMNYLGTMLRNLVYDNIGHEHLCYYSLTTLNDLFTKHGFLITDVEQNMVNGGSFRVYAKKNLTGGRRSEPRVRHVREMLNEEAGMFSHDAYTDFAERVTAHATQMKSFLSELRARGKRVFAYGASTRGSTLLQTICGDTPATSLLAGVAERDPRKYGRRMAHLDLPIVPEAEARLEADYFLLLPYQFWDAISLREREWMLAGGKFIIPLPRPRVVTMVEIGAPGTFLPVAVDIDKSLEELVG